MPTKSRLLTPFVLAIIFTLFPLSGTSQSPSVAEAAKPFYLHENDTVVFYGDSITEQRYYTQFVDVYTVTRFPHMQVQFYNAGIGGDRVTGGSGGPIDLRLQRDVFPQKPTVVTIMLGMNDGSYRPLTPEIESQYTQGYEHILDSIHKALPNARMTLFGPSPYDEITRPEMFPGGYNATLVKFSRIDSDLARKHNATYIDLNAPFAEAIKRGSELMPTATQILLPDRVHPEQLAHWFMADAILKGWNAPTIVTSVTIDAASAKVTDQQRAHITELKGGQTALAWNELDEALPLPIDDKHAGYHFLRQLNDIVADLDQQPLKVEHLDPGSYQLTIDDSLIGRFTAEELAKGINLAEYGTPMRGQAYRVSWLVRDRDDTHYVRLRMFANEFKTGLSAQPGATDLTKFEQVQQQHIYEEAQPVQHTFQIKAAASVQ
jgi:lysophospholipase L1-like esterase